MIEQRRQAFQTLLAHYHNSFENPSKDEAVRHSPNYLLNLLDTGKPDEVVEAVRLDPRLTATDEGGVAVQIARRVMTDPELSKNFIDLELAEDGSCVVYFDAKAKEARVSEALKAIGDAGILARPGQKIGEGITSDLFLVAVSPQAAVRESLLKEMRDSLVEEEDEDEDDEDDDKDDKDDDDEKDDEDDDKDEDDKKKGKGKKKKDESTPAPWQMECQILGIDQDDHSPEALKARPVSLQQIKALFVETYGAKALTDALNGELVGAGELRAPAPATEDDQRGRLLRMLSSRKALPGTMRADESAGFQAVWNILMKRMADAKAEKRGKFQVLEAEAFTKLVNDVAADLSEAAPADLDDLFLRAAIDNGVRPLTENLKTAASRRLAEALAAEDRNPAARVLQIVAKASAIRAGILPAALAEAAEAAQAPQKQSVVEETIEAFFG